MRDPQQIQAALEQIAALLAFSGANKFKAQAYERAAEVVEALAAEDLGRLIEAGTLTEVEGIGPSLEKQITELWHTGASALLERLRSEHPPGAEALLRLPGLTPRRVIALHGGLGIDSLAALQTACAAKRVRTVPGFGPKLEQRLLAALAEHARAATAPRRLLLSEARSLAERIAQHLRLHAPVFDVLHAGELRRGEETVGSLSMVAVIAAESDTAALFDALTGLSNVARIDRDTGTVQLTEGIPLILHPTLLARCGATLLRATGTPEHLALLDARRDTPTGLSTPSAIAMHAASEDDIYRALGLSPIPPELRSGTDEVASAAHEDFADLVEQTAILGMVHCHTTYSDGRHGIEEMARAAEALGMAYITITDHSPSAHYAHGVEIERLKRQWDEIAAVQERVGIRILRGTESDILADGSLDYPDHVLEQLDVVIASVHARFRLGRSEMTERLTRALKLPIFKIWGHALGRLLLRRQPIDCDVEAVLDALASAPGAIELNGDPRRLDLPPTWIAPARARGIPFVLSVDAHSTQGLGVLSFAVTMARRGGLRRREVLNTLPADQFIAAVRPAR